MEVLDQLLANPIIREILLAVLGVSAIATVFEDVIANLVGRIPYIGKVAAPIARRLSLNFWNWLKRRAETAEKVVKETEALAPGAAGPTKKAIATSKLQQAEPGMVSGELDREIEAALQRVKGEAAIVGGR